MKKLVLGNSRNGNIMQVLIYDICQIWKLGITTDNKLETRSNSRNWRSSIKEKNEFEGKLYKHFYMPILNFKKP